MPQAIGVDRDTPAVVLKLDQNVFHHGGLGVIRGLGRLGVPVYAVREDRFAPAAWSRYLCGGWVWRPDPADVALLRAGLRRLADRIGRPAVLIPTDDAGAIFLAEHGEPLRDSFLFPAPAPGLPRWLADKYALHELCRELGVPHADTVLVRSVADAREFAGRVGLPVVVKLTRPWNGPGSGLRSTTVVRTRAELDELVRRAGGAELMVQEYLPGGPGHDWFAHGYRGASGTRPVFTGRKQRSYPAHAGLTCLGRAVRNDRLAAEVTALLDRLRFHGIVDLDLRFDPRDDTYKLLDFNPRLGAQFRLFHDEAGIDVAVAAHLDLTGRPVPAGRQVERGFLVENYDPIAALRYWRGGELSVRSWLASLRGVDELAWFAADDLVPFGLMCARLGWRALHRPFARGRKRPVLDVPRYRAGRAADPGRSRSQRRETTQCPISST